MPRFPLPGRRAPAGALVACVAVVAVLALAGCGAQEAAPRADGSSSPSPSSTSAASAQTIDVRVAGDRVTPRNARIEVRAGEPVTLRVVSDRKGELHVHSSPETTFDFGPGTHSRTITIDRPGLVEMEEHVSDTLVAQLEAR